MGNGDLAWLILIWADQSCTSAFTDAAPSSPIQAAARYLEEGECSPLALVAPQPVPTKSWIWGRRGFLPIPAQAVDCAASVIDF